MEESDQATRLPPHEDERLLALQRYQILDTAEEASFDRFTRLACRLFGAPIALVSLVDKDRQWFKSCVGLDVRETSRDVAFCAHAILGDGPLVVADATKDYRFASNPLVTGPPYIRFYAGAPLCTADGYKLGTLCIIDRKPRTLGANDLATLSDLAALVVEQIEQRRLAARLHESEESFRALVDSSRDGISVMRPDATVAFANPALAHMLAYRTPEDLQRIYFPAAVHPDDRVAAGDRLKRGLSGEVLPLSELRLLGADGRVVLVEVATRPLNFQGELGIFSVLRDVTELRRLQSAERAQARTDHLTGLPNRRALEEVVQRELAHADRHGLGLCLALFDIDHFKDVNDRHGHDAGDRILEMMGSVLRANVRQGDLPVRWGGEEFLVFMPATPLPGARSLAERVRARMEAQSAELGPVGVTVSAGIAERRAAETFADLFARTDDLLYAAKTAGRNRVVEPA